MSLRGESNIDYSAHDNFRPSASYSLEIQFLCGRKDSRSLLGAVIGPRYESRNYNGHTAGLK